MSCHFNDIEISNFKGIDHLKIKGFKSLNVFVGANNVGKTSILEAIFMLSGMSNPWMATRINSLHNSALGTIDGVRFLFHNLDFSNKPLLKAAFGNSTRRLTFEPVIDNDDSVQSSVSSSRFVIRRLNFEFSSGDRDNYSYRSALFLNKENKLEYVWASSWGVSTRLMGALIMTHSDDHGLVLPPKLAPIQVAIVPIYRNKEQLAQISEAALQLKAELQAKGIRVKYDDNDNQKPGWKFTEYEFKGVPVRIAIGPRDMENGTAEICRRDTLEKSIHPQAGLVDLIPALLDEIQKSLFDRALKFRLDNTVKVDNWEDFKVLIEQGKFLLAHWDGTTETEIKIKEETKATIRAIPFDIEPEEGKCVYSGRPSKHRVIFAKAY